MRMTGDMLAPSTKFQRFPRRAYAKCHGVGVFMRRSIQGNVRNRSEVQKADVGYVSALSGGHETRRSRFQLSGTNRARPVAHGRLATEYFPRFFGRHELDSQ